MLYSVSSLCVSFFQKNFLPSFTVLVVINYGRRSKPSFFFSAQESCSVEMAASVWIDMDKFPHVQICGKDIYNPIFSRYYFD